MIMNNQELKGAQFIGGNDNTSDKSDIQTQLLSIEYLYVASRNVINSHAVAAILLALAFEAQTLLLKLQSMSRRWSIHLPFKEACQVDFIDWSSRMNLLAENIKASDARYCLNPRHDRPSCHYLLDLYELACSSSGESGTDRVAYHECDPKQMLSHCDSLKDELNAQREECIEAITKMVTCHLSGKADIGFEHLSDLTGIRSACSSILSELSEELTMIHDQLVKIFTPKEYERLAERILLEEEYGGPVARREAREICFNWRNGVPKGKLEESRKAQMEATKEELRKTKHGVKLEQYVNLDDDFYSQRSEFGKFLFNRRRDITHEELRELMRLVYCVYYYQKDATQEAERRAGVVALPEESETEDMILPTDFLQPLRANQPAVRLFMKILCQVEPYMNSGIGPSDGDPEGARLYKDWTWCYLVEAFMKLDFWPKDGNKAAFSKFIHSQFPNRSEDSVKRALYRDTNTNSRSIVADIVKKFDPVRSLLNR